MYPLFFFPLSWDPTFILLIPAIILTLYAQAKIKSAYAKYSKVYARSGLTGAQVARRLLDHDNLNNVAVEMIDGELTDHYDPRQNVMKLSEGVYSSRSVAAIGVAAHETGHAIQHAAGYAPLSLRNSIVPVDRLRI